MLQSEYRVLKIASDFLSVAIIALIRRKKIQVILINYYKLNRNLQFFIAYKICRKVFFFLSF